MDGCIYCGMSVEGYNDSVIIHDGCVEPARVALAEIASLRARVAELEAWQPVDVATVKCGCHEEGCDSRMEIEHGMIQVETGDSLASIKLPDGWSLYRRRPHASV